MRRFLSTPVLLTTLACGSSESPSVSPAADAGGDANAPANLTVEGPVSGGRGSPFVSGTSFDLAEVGYSGEEYFVSGVARAFSAVGALDGDGKWTAEPAATKDFKTRIVVYRPSDASRFNGSVIVEWLNVSGGVDAAPDWISAHTELTRKGMVWVGVSAQRVGVEGGQNPIPGLPETSLKKYDPERYGSLVHPGDSFSYDIFSQVGALLRSSKSPDPLHGLKPARVIAAGESQSAFRLVTYVNAIDPLARVYDGYMVHSRGGGGAPLSEAPEPAIAAMSPARIRDDVRVPVLTLQTETDLIMLGFLPARQPDFAKHRLWEIAGTAHADTYTIQVGAGDRGNDPAAANVVVTNAPLPGVIECDRPINSGPHHFVLKAGFAALDAWVKDGTLPATAPLLETQGTPPSFVLDEHGNARGGIRTAHVDAPIATLSGLGQTGSGFCAIFGTTVPFDAAKLKTLYPTHDAYVSAVNQATERAVNAGFLLSADAALIRAAAEASTIGN